MRIPRLPRLPRLPIQALLLMLLASGSPAAAPAPDVRLNEILAAPARDWDGSGTFSSRDDEWVEIVNGGATAAELSGYFLTDGDSIPRFAFTGTLAPGEVFLVTGTLSVAWERETSHPVFGLSLGNTGDQVLLWRVTGSDTTLVDGYTYKVHESAADRASGRSSDGSEWRLEDQLNPYTGSALPAGTGCPPTPGTPNSCGVTPTRHETWGRVKSLWR